MTLKVKKSIPVKEYIREYVRLRDEKKRIDSRLSQISEALKQYAEEKGQKDDKGSYYFERDGYSVGKQARKTITFDTEKAVKFFRKRGYPECIVTHEEIDMDAVNELFSEGEITEEDLEKITNTKVSYSISINPVEEVTDEVSESTVRGKRG